MGVGMNIREWIAGHNDVIGAYVGENTPVFVTLYNPGTN